MTKADINRVYELETLCFRTPWSKNALMSELKNDAAHYLVCVLDGLIIAYGGMWVLFAEAHVTNVAVDPNLRRLGIGKAFMLRMMQLAQTLGATAMTLEVRETNAAAQGLYFSLGFKKAGVRKKYYSDTREDAWILWNEDIGFRIQDSGFSNAMK